MSGGSRWATRILREKPDRACGRLPRLPALFQGIIQPDVSWEPARFSPVGQCGWPGDPWSVAVLLGAVPFNPGDPSTRLVPELDWGPPIQLG